MPSAKKTGQAQEEKLYTIADISRELNIAKSTIRYWRDKFEEFIPAAGQGRKRRYKRESVEVFKKIAEWSRQNYNTQKIIEFLKQENNQKTEKTNVVEVPQKNDSNKNISVVSNNTNNNDKRLPVEKLAYAVEKLVDQQEEIRRLNSKVDNLEEQLKIKFEERDRKFMEALRQIQEQKKPWWKRVKLFNSNKQ